MLQCGVQPDYVLDRMQTYEIETLLENLWMKNKESWEQTRVQAYITAQTQSTKKIDMNDMMSFPWEKKVEKVEDTPEDIEMMRKEMKEMEDKLNKKIIVI